MDAECERECVRLDSQDVGLEAAIIERVRNSSLVECAGTDNVARLSVLPKRWLWWKVSLPDWVTRASASAQGIGRREARG